MNEREILVHVAQELGVESAHPDLDQMDAAVVQTLSVARKLRRRGATLIRLADGEGEVPSPVMAWLNFFADQLGMDGRTCGHVHMATPTLLFASKPNVRYCYPCGDARAQRIAQQANHGFAWDCDFCGVPTDLLRLRPVVIPFISILVRGFGCDGCLSTVGTGVPK